MTISSSKSRKKRTAQPADPLTLARAFLERLRADRRSSQTSREVQFLPDGREDPKPDEDMPVHLPIDLVVAAIRLADTVSRHSELLRDLDLGEPRVLVVEIDDPRDINHLKTAARVCLLGGRTLLSTSVLDSKITSATDGAIVIAAGVSRWTSKDADDLAATALSLNVPIAAFACELKELPADIVRAADVTVRLAALTSASIALAVEAVAGRTPAMTVPDELATRASASDMRIALRGKPDGDACVKRLERLIKQRLAVDDAGPPLEALTGYGEAKSIGLGIAADLRALAAGELQWADIDRGLLLVGPPGTGKTLFASALARSAKVSLIASSLARWQSARDGHLGHTLAAMRASFTRARLEAPCILLVDELDSFGDRTRFSDKDRDYCTQVVNAFLELLDGVEGREGVVVVGAANSVAGIDPAIRRAGRLDRTISIQLPDLGALTGILRHHLGSRLAEEDLSDVAIAGQGATGADVASWVRRAAGSARRSGRELVKDDLFKEIRDGRPPLGRDVRWRIAVHESGHAVVGLAFGVVEVCDISIHADGGLSVNALPSRDFSRSELIALIAQAMAGRAAERVVCGDSRSGSGGGADSDLAIATRLASSIENSFGLGRGGAVWLGEPADPTWMLRSPNSVRHVRETLEEAEALATETLIENGKALVGLAKALEKQSYLRRSEILSIVGELKAPPFPAPSDSADEARRHG